MRVDSAFCFSLLSLLSSVYSSPIPGALKIMSSYDHKNKVSVYQNQQRVAVLRKANKEANSQFKHMQRVLKDPKKPEHAAAIQKAFGDHPDLAAIAQNVKLLEKKTLLIKTVEEPFNPKKPHNIAFARMRKDKKKHLHFTDKFFNQKTPLGQAGTLIHEASHQLLDTKDNFEHTGPGAFRPLSKKAADKSQHPIKSGYLHNNYEEIKQEASHNMHHNADSYKAFGHYAKHGANTAMDHNI